MFGAVISLWPDLSFRELGAWGYARAAAGAATGTMAAILIAMGPERRLRHPTQHPRYSPSPIAARRVGSPKLAPAGYYYAAIPLFGLVAGVSLYPAPPRTEHRRLATDTRHVRASSALPSLALGGAASRGSGGHVCRTLGRYAAGAVMVLALIALAAR